MYLFKLIELKKAHISPEKDMGSFFYFSVLIN